MIDQPGIYELPAEVYHADPVGPAPSLSASIAKKLLGQSPLHANYAHPRLNPEYEREDSERFDLGTAVHAHLLEGETAFAVIDADDWRTKAAKDARELARLAGRVPLLREQWERVQAMAAAARTQLTRFSEPPRPLTGGVAERVLVWYEEELDIWCRARVDYLHDDYRTVDDLKSTGASANPDLWTRTVLWNTGFDIQAAFYLRGLAVLTGVDATFRFVVQENYEPYALSVIGLEPEALALAEKKRRLAVKLWAECLTTNRWPGYPTRTCYAALPPWLEAQWLERELRDERPSARPARQTDIIDDGRPIGEQLAGMGELER